MANLAARIYRDLLHLYPAEHRAQFAAEMADVFAARAIERRASGKFEFLWFVLQEFSGVIAGALEVRLIPRGQDLRTWREASAVSVEAVESVRQVELEAARRRVQANVDQMVTAIAGHQFEQARYYAREEEREREYLRTLETRSRGETS